MTTEQLYTRAWELHGLGKPLKAISEEVGFSVTTLRQYFKTRAQAELTLKAKLEAKLAEAAKQNLPTADDIEIKYARQIIALHRKDDELVRERERIEGERKRGYDRMLQIDNERRLIPSGVKTIEQECTSHLNTLAGLTQQNTKPSSDRCRDLIAAGVQKDPLKAYILRVTGAELTRDVKPEQWPEVLRPLEALLVWEGKAAVNALIATPQAEPDEPF